MPPPLTRFNRASSARRMRGIATVLILLLVGLGLLAAVLGTIAYIRGSQSQDISSHAQTQAQAKAWTGAEIVQTYLNSLKNDGKLTTLLAKTGVTPSSPIVLSLQGDGITDLVTANVVSVNPTEQSLIVNITGRTAAGTRAEASSTLAVIYGVGSGSTPSPGSSGGAAGTCGAQPKASTIFRGNVTISGGETSFTSNGEYANLAIDGDLKISSASPATVSTCAKGNIDMTGGGLKDNATFTSQGGRIVIKSMSPPKNAMLWAQTINIEQDGGTYSAIKAGAYHVSIVNPTTNATLGSAEAGGKLVASTAGAVPWVTGTIVPWATGSLFITLNDGTQYLVNMSAVTINATSGIVTGAQAAAIPISGSATMPDSFKLVSTSIYGGDVGVAAQIKVSQLWGYAVTMRDYSNGDYPQVWSAGNFKVGTGSIGTLIGGGGMQATVGGCSGPTNCWNFPTISNASNIAGGISYGNGTPGTPVAGTRPNLTINQTHTSPGLPGAPFCDTRTNAVDVESYKAQANYIFFFDSNGSPRLTIQNVKTSSGTSIDRANIDVSVDVPELRRIGGQDFLVCNNQPSNNPNGLFCLTSAKRNTGWNMNGIKSFPPGIAWFEGQVTIGITTQVLNNTFLATGNVTLGSASNSFISAPNLAAVSTVCDGNFYPSNLCNKTTTPSSLATWTDNAGVARNGLPIANIAIGTNGNLISQGGWTINGSVILGGSLATSGAVTKINGALAVGSNTKSDTNITAGGVKVDTSKLTSDQSIQPGTSCASPTPPQPIKMRWARYL